MIHGHFGARRAELITIILGELNKTGFILILVLAILANLHYHFCVCEPDLTNIKPLEILNTLQSITSSRYQICSVALKSIINSNSITNSFYS